MPNFCLSDPINIQDIHLAPDVPGLYVWYARFEVGKADWHTDYVGNNLSADIAFQKCIKRHSMKFSQQEMYINAKANFSIEWNGTMKENSLFRRENGTGNDHPEIILDELAKVTEKNHTRSALINCISNSFPFFSSPLYIGLAVEQTLKERLKQHKKALLDLWERSSHDKDFIDRIVPLKFADRAIKLGFRPDDLYCYTLSVNLFPEDELTRDELKSLIVSAEWILNRWTTPILGRR